MRTRIHFVVGLVALLAGPAVAADLDLEPQTPRRIAEQRYDWTGLYFGINAGYGWARTEGQTSIGGTLGVIAPNPATDIAGGVFGGQTGFNWQLTHGLVFGGELDAMWGGGSQTVVSACGAGCSITSAVRIKGFGTVRARIGMAFHRVLVYATLGGALGFVADDLTVTSGGVTAPFLPLSAVRPGWTAGFGVEGAFWGHWSARLEYLYVDVTGPSSGVVAGPFQLPVVGGIVTQTRQVHENLVRAGVNYRFGP